MLYRDCGIFSKKSLATCVPVIWKFLNQNLPLYIWTVIYDIPLDFIDENLNLLDPNILNSAGGVSRLAQQLKATEKNPLQKPTAFKYAGFEIIEDVECDNDIEMIALQLIELITTLVNKQALREILRVGIYPLSNAISFYMMMTMFDVTSTFFDV